PWTGAAGALVGLAGDDAARQVLEVEAGGGELLRQAAQQLRVRWRVGLVEIVQGVDEAAPEEVRPQPVDGGAGEVGIVDCRRPLSKRRPEGFLFIERRLGPAEEAGVDGLPRRLPRPGRDHNGGAAHCDDAPALLSWNG